MSEEENANPTSSPDDAPPRKFKPAERIEELNDIDKSISDLLGSAVSALKVLANIPTPRLADLESQKTAFSEATESYLSTLSNIDVRLRRNVYALEEAGLVNRDGKRGAAGVYSEEGRTGGNGPLDRSWLNARSSDSVIKGMDREIWADARKFVERLQVKGPGVDAEAPRDEMDVDETEHD